LTQRCTAQATQLSDQENALSVQQNRLIDAATLIGDLGGGWSSTQLHDAQHPQKTADRFGANLVKSP
jgi:outer membrane protein TolC